MPGRGTSTPRPSLRASRELALQAGPCPRDRRVHRREHPVEVLRRSGVAELREHVPSPPGQVRVISAMYGSSLSWPAAGSTAAAWSSAGCTALASRTGASVSTSAASSQESSTAGTWPAPVSRTSVTSCTASPASPWCDLCGLVQLPCLLAAPVSRTCQPASTRQGARGR